MGSYYRRDTHIGNDCSRSSRRNICAGVTDTEIKLGQTSPYSGPASAYSVIAMAQLACFETINDQGGVNGRKITLISFDDAYSPPKTVEQTRKLVEQDEVAAILNPLGTPAGLSVCRKFK
jgi:ABC-type branched-subunit amino acid transport system substrate-binding protein